MTKSMGAAAVITVLLLAPACTDLTENPQSSITPENFYRNEDEVIGGLASVYAQLRSTTDEAYNISEISTDEMIVPTRGQDWLDGGKWLDIHRQTFTPNSPAGLDNINSAWVNLFQGVAKANVVLDGVQNVGFNNKAIIVAELRTLRAFYYYLLMDLFGGVPIVCADQGNAICTGTGIMARPQNTRTEVFAFIEAELNAARADLPVTWSAEMNGRLTKGAADAILASMYLNAQVFTGTVSATGLTKGTARWQDAINACDRILNSTAAYQLQANWRSNFTADNYNSREIIMAVKFLNQSGLGLNFLMRALHYNQFTPSPWNGFATLAETYNAFNANDIRRSIFLAGLQYNVETGLPVNDRQGNPLIFDPNIGNETAATEGAGVRITKWPYDPAHVQQDNGNDYAHFRLAEIDLIKAEALNELGQTAAAIALINTTTRARAFPTVPRPLPALTQAALRDSILAERLFELTAEGKRRTDLIRIGASQGGVNKYNLPWAYKTTTTAAYKILFPIPQVQIDVNPLLVQNAGY
ncbi:MAG: RagB/SusD family nutrient uptake outer membrane protein [Gemmatimonadota bacterium]|nr:RagB/SusD family nutrient uptake outer membrane protein [Gemmatimonadota bacterium]